MKGREMLIRDQFELMLTVEDKVYKVMDEFTFRLKEMELLGDILRKKEKQFYVVLYNSHEDMSFLIVTKRWYETFHQMERRISDYAHSIGAEWRFATLHERKRMDVEFGQMERYLTERM